MTDGGKVRETPNKYRLFIALYVVMGGCLANSDHPKVGLASRAVTKLPMSLL